MVFAIFIFIVFVVFLLAGTGCLVQFVAYALSATPEQAVAASHCYIIVICVFLLVMYIISIPCIQRENAEAEKYNKAEAEKRYRCDHASDSQIHLWK